MAGVTVRRDRTPFEKATDCKWGSTCYNKDNKENPCRFNHPTVSRLVFTCSICNSKAHTTQNHTYVDPCSYCKSETHKSSQHKCDSCNKEGHSSADHCSFCNKVHTIDNHTCSGCKRAGHEGNCVAHLGREVDELRSMIQGMYNTLIKVTNNNKKTCTRCGGVGLIDYGDDFSEPCPSCS